MTLRKLTEKDVEFEVEVFPEEMEVEGNASAIDDETDKQIVDEINRRLDDGDIWAWCMVKVTAKFGRFSGEDYLGGCSYKDEDDFKQEGGYWEDMKAQALDDLNKNLEVAYQEIKGLIS